MTDHPITPPPDLMQRWREQAPRYRDGGVGREYWMMARAAQWGADRELGACCEWMRNQHLVTFNDRIPLLRAARRPKPPSLKEQALAAQQRMWNGGSTHEDWQLIRRALEALPDD